MVHKRVTEVKRAQAEAAWVVKFNRKEQRTQSSQKEIRKADEDFAS